MDEQEVEESVKLARDQLEKQVALFNEFFSSWEDFFKMGANIGTVYVPETGRKKFTVLDIAPLPQTKPKKDDPNVVAAGETIRKADEALNGAPEEQSGPKA